MRFETVDLVRYGRFTNRRLKLPQQECDFHLIVGRNEAGKSTLRQAFHDLLFGIPMNSPMSFLHAGSELELRAMLSGPAGKLEFSRLRKRKGGLVDHNGEAMAPEALRPWLGDVTEAFYERMFGLDHRRLEKGGHAMLQASDDVDSVLFQAAAGVSALNGVLDRLRQEASQLWAPRRSRDRAWYVAADRLADAEATLKSATVRPTAWADAHREAQRLEAEFASAEAEHARLLAEVRDLERLRRSAPVLAQLRECEAAFGAPNSPSDAHVRILQHQAEILQLEERRARVAQHRAGIAECESRSSVIGSRLEEVMRRLGRHTADLASTSPDALLAGLPSRPLRQEILQLLQNGRQTRIQRDQARKTLDDRQAEAERLQLEIASLPPVSMNRALRVALNEIDAAGDIDAQGRAARRNRERDERIVRQRLDALALPGVEVSDSIPQALQWLKRMNAWQAGTLAEEAQRRRRLQDEVDGLQRRIRDTDLERQNSLLKLDQFRRSHHAVSREEILAARRERDALWGELARGEVQLDAQATRFTTLIAHADNLVDLHVQAMGDAARLQTLQHEHERLDASFEALRNAAANASAALDAHIAEWEDACAQRHLPTLAPAELQGWLVSREAVFEAFERLQASSHEQAVLEERHAALFAGLMTALREEGEAVDDVDTVDAARDLARVRLHRAEQAQTRRQALKEQYARIESLLPSLQRELLRLEADVSRWQGRWHDALGRANLQGASDDAFIEAALTLLADAEEHAMAFRDCGVERTRLQKELDGFENGVRELATALGDVQAAHDAAEACVRRWTAQLEHARSLQRQQEEARNLAARLTERLLEEGEGRSREQIESELDALDVSTLARQADSLGSALEQAAARSNRLAVEHEQARQDLEAMSGGDAAAQAEARRQEALADMGGIAERYIALYAQYRLLEEVTERYRERRQGPLLERAGRLFSDLTLGAHGGLVLDTEEASLLARRADGSLVPLDGLSDGTRDQLYLALRLSALELYLDSAAPMPFIADDLFVNYDDRRAVAGLQKLGEVANRTQVVFLTHHVHMVELAQEALAGRANVMVLTDDADHAAHML